MSKIEELAKEYCQGSSFDDACMMNPAYIAGANAVLREIEKYIGNSDELAAQLIKDKIRELKGE